jgi:hypothetical protein
MQTQDHPTSFGVFKPVGHVVISFPSQPQAEDARSALAADGLSGDAVTPYTAGQMLAQIDEDLANASPLANLGQEINLIKAHRALAERGYHWLVVRVEDDEMGRRVADRALAFGAERAQLYGRFIIEELIEHTTDTPQVAESPDRGLDPQTPSGEEAERAALRPAREG